MIRQVLSAALVAILGVAVAAPSGAGAAPASGSWLGAWAAPPQAQDAPGPGGLQPIRDQTLRQRVNVQVAGRQVRLSLSNAYGSKPLKIGAVSIGRAAGDNLQVREIVPVTFGGQASITIPVGAPALSDPVALAVRPGETLVVSLHLPQETLPETYHRPPAGQDLASARGGPDALLSGPGDHTRAASLPDPKPTPRLFLARLDVLTERPGRAVVVLGTTRTVGGGRWPELLGERLAGAGGGPVSVVNASLVANPLTRPYPGGGEAALTRFDRDVLMTPGVSHVVIADAINDIGQPGGNVIAASEAPDLALLQAAYRQLVERAHARGVKVIASTLMPFEGVPFPGFYTPQKEPLRAALNQWIRTSGAFDGVIDMDALVRDPAHPTRFAPGLETANHFAPNEAGEKKIAAAIDLGLFR